MMCYHSTLFFILSVGLGAIAVPPPGVCNANNCLRSVRASSSRGAADCSSYLMAIVTPAPSTVTRTATSMVTAMAIAIATITNAGTITNTVTVTKVLAVTATSTFIDTSTTTALVTLTTTVPTTATVSLPTFTTTYPVTPTPEPDSDLDTRDEHLAPRQQTVWPSQIPTYASSACSDAAAYSSACSCIGVTGATTTVARPTTTTTTTATVTATITLTKTQTSSTTYTVVQTQTVPVTQTTTVITTIGQTVIVPGTTTDGATATVATTTVTPCPSGMPTFLLRAAGGGPYDGSYVQLQSEGYFSSTEIIYFTTDESAASALSLNAAGNLADRDSLAAVWPGHTTALIRFNTADVIAANGYVLAICTIAAGTLSCVNQTTTIFQTCPNPFGGPDAFQITQDPAGGCTTLTLNVIPLCTFA